MTLLEKQHRLLADLAMFDDPQEKLSAVLDRAKKVPPFPPTLRSEAHRVHGCVSVVWLVGDVRASRCHFQGDAESLLVRGLVVLLCDFFSDAAPSELALTAADPLEALGVARNLSPTRRHGLAATRSAIIAFAARQLAPGPSGPSA